MKALVVLLSVVVVSSTRVLEKKRSLLGVGQHNEHHQELERTGRDSPVSAPAGYLPPAEDDYVDYDDDSAGFGTGKGDSTGNDVRGFGQQGQDNDNQQSQYGQKDRSGTLGHSVAGQSSNKRRYGAPGQGQDNNKSQIGHQRGQIQSGDQLRGQNQGGFIKGNSFGDQQVQDQSADESYGAPSQGSENNKFKQNQNIQNQRASAFPGQFGTSGSITSTINRFLPSSCNIANVNSGHGAPQFSEQTGQNFDAGQSEPSIQRSQAGNDKNSNTVSQFAVQGAQQGLSTNGFHFPSISSNDFELEDSHICPGGTVETCIKVCPGNTAKLYGGCIQGCADRCDALRQGAQFGQEGNPGQGAQFGQQGNSGQSAQFGQQGNSKQSAQFGQEGNPGQGGQFGQQGYSGQAGQQGNTRQSTQLGQNGEDQQVQYGHHND